VKVRVEKYHADYLLQDSILRRDCGYAGSIECCPISRHALRGCADAVRGLTGALVDAFERQRPESMDS